MTPRVEGWSDKKLIHVKDTFMKNLFLFILAYCISAHSITAQPTLTMDLVPDIGVTYDAKFSEGTIDPGNAGANQYWDYSNLTTGIDIHFATLLPEDAPGAEYYPDADFVWHLVEFESFIYYQITDDSISQMGGVNGAIGNITFHTINTDLEDGIHLPINFGDSYSFLTVYDNYLFGNYLSTGSRDATLTADGWGTLVTEFGTYNNVMRVKIIREEFGFSSTQYAWMHPSSMIPLMLYEFSDDPEIIPSYYFTDFSEVVSSSRDNELSVTSIVYDANNILLESDSELDIEGIQLLDGYGNSIGFTSELLTPNQRIIHPLADLAMGIYYIQVYGDKKSGVSKIFIY